MKPILSIIVPVYKVEKYIHRCISSILNQSFTDFELILIDDGSPDNCGTICDEYAQEDNRIIIIHQKNQGTSTARNVGLDLAKGEYITFVDSDDIISKDTYEDNMKILLNENDIDVLEYPYYIVGNQEHRILTDPESHIYGKKNIFLYWTLHTNKGYIVCDKIFKRHIFESVRFPVGKIYEDFYIFPDIAEKVSHLYISNKGIYYYLTREDSQSNGDFSLKRDQPLNKQLDHYDAWLKVNDKIKDYKAYNKERIFNYYRFVSAFICTEIDNPNIKLYEYEKRFEAFNFSIITILYSKLKFKEKIKLILIKVFSIKWLVFFINSYKFNKITHIK